MDGKSNLFDLKREKQELDQFLSTIAASDMPLSGPVKDTASAGESRQAEKKPLAEAAKQDIPRPRPLASADRTEEIYMQPAYQEKPASRAAEAIQPAAETTETKPKIKSSFLPDTEEKPVDVSLQSKRPPVESVKTVPSFEPTPFEDELKKQPAPASEETAIIADIETGRKIEDVHPTESESESEPEARTTGKGKRTGLLILLVVLLLAAAAWFYSGAIIQTAKSIPGVGGVIKGLVSAEKDVNLVNVRQRLVYNAKIGKSIRVVEGLAANISSQPISNIKITASLHDSGGSELIAMESFAGNILTDEKLETLDAGAIKAALQAAKGAPDKKVQPKGQTPFMIVFTSEPAGVFKMSVTPVDFTK